MYIGRLGKGNHHDDGIYIMVKEIIDNAIDEYIMGHGRKVVVNISGNQVSVRDYGRGIPLGKIVECVSIINTGAKYNDEVFQFSVGLNGVGTKAVNALAHTFEVTSHRDGRYRRATFVRGVLQNEEEGEWKGRGGTLVRFVADPEIFRDYAIDLDFVRHRLWFYAYLNEGLTLTLNGEKFHSPNGLKDLLATEIRDAGLYDIVSFRDRNIQFAFSHTRSFGEVFFSFVNGQFTNDGGTHLSAFKEGILKGMNTFYKKSFQGADVRDGIVGAIAIKIQDPVFESQTKNKLGNTDIKSWIINIVKDAVVDFLFQNPEAADDLQEKILTNERIRKELSAVRKEAREKAKKISLKIPNLKDCKNHFGDGTPAGERSMIFITEGQSAAGSMVECRDVMSQAIFSLKGKPMNCFGAKREAIYTNDELYNITQALGVENDPENLRYSKVVLATDSDVDGLHIRNLMITFFLHFFDSLVLKERLFILETPLFRVRDKKRTFYCYDEAEKQRAIKEIGVKNAEITRFKGLGEISPKEFGQFIGDDIRLQEVNVEFISDVPDILRFFMGKNTPKRREYIMDNLVSEDEEKALQK
ncbi:MAG: DNA topoisomerase IV [Candidatus Wallbacteria bacterium HGW-Wallbacteria-1]|uniref:DNA topoisomerase (ATP-hydrolyzing) n=1 Tax=Candidatus Wallbacteria bacterium HGW-Wallbacteria-1 TaxID=2013854 RepID=A0A2N1PKA4_9BACT|nr:MAG: DNA topoisomerase IV [Candidatus Wallbacteria bacterium HGW-Wallbacteria-1]